MLHFVLTLALAVTAPYGLDNVQAKPLLGQPFDVLPLSNGHLVVTDMSAGKVYDLDPPHRSGRSIASIAKARELGLLRDGRLLVTSAATVLALDRRTGRTTVYARASDYLLGIALAADGWLYASENKPGSETTTLVRLRGRTREVLGTFRGVHGILVDRGRLILGEAYAGRVLRFDPATKTTEVLASGLGNPGFAIPAAAGGWFVSEFAANRVSHLWPDGHVTTVARISQPGPIAFDSRRRIVGVTLGGTVFRIERGRARTIYP